MTNIKKPHELSVQTNIKALIYGQPGLGKTTFALSAPKPLLLDFDNGVHRVSPEHQTDTIQIDSWQNVLDEMNEGTFNNYQTIIIDTAGKMLDYLGAWLIAKNPKLGKTNGALSLQGYGERKGEFSGFIKKLGTMGKHIIFLAHEKEEKEGDGKYIRPEVGGSSGNDLYKELDLIGYMEAIGKKRTISFLPQEKYYAKNACGLNEVIEIPELKAGVTNNYFTNNIIGLYEKSLLERKEKVGEYSELMATITAKVEDIKDVETANEVSEWAKNFTGHIWSSKIIAAKSINDKCKELGMKFNTKTSKYDYATKPETAAI